MTSSPNIQPANERTDVRISLKDGSVWSAPVGTPLEGIIHHIYPEHSPHTGPTAGLNPIIAALVDGELEELTVRMTRDALVEPLMLDSSDGLRIYRRSLSLLLVVAAHELFPDRTIKISHSLPFGGYYCYVSQGDPFTPEDIAAIKKRMDEIVALDEPISRRVVSRQEALDIFGQNGDDDKMRLLKSRAHSRTHIVLYTLRGIQDYFYGYMVPSTRYLHIYDLKCDGEGFILRYPRSKEPTILQEEYALPRLRSVFEQTEHWLTLLGIEDMGALNQANIDRHLSELVLVAEALHEGRYADIADAVVERRPEVRLVLIAGPSSSGKTTSSKRLAIQLMAHGLKPYTIGLDDYFVPRSQTPRDETGDYDYEHIEAVDIDLFNDHLLKLMDGETVALPHYNFHTGKREKGDTVALTHDMIVIVEGIHALNPRFVHAIPPERVFRLYVSCLTQLNIDRHNRVPTTDVRLLRRIVRDAAYRGYSAQATIARWESVRRGERRWIFPYQENADLMFNSALVYELAVLGPLAEPLLRQVDTSSPEWVEAKRLLSFLTWVEPFTEPSLIPGNSVLREFIGGSTLADYTPGHAAEQ